MVKLSTPPFSYRLMTMRNDGFVTDEEQGRLRNASVFICGVGGMGGAALQALVRAGVGNFTIADMDTFEISNLNRHLFATLDTMGRSKTEAVSETVARINPEARVDLLGDDWVDRLDELLFRHRVVINGMDDPRGAIALYRKARELGA